MMELESTKRFQDAQIRNMERENVLANEGLALEREGLKQKKKATKIGAGIEAGKLAFSMIGDGGKDMTISGLGSKIKGGVSNIFGSSKGAATAFRAKEAAGGIVGPEASKSGMFSGAGKLGIGGNMLAPGLAGFGAGALLGDASKGKKALVGGGIGALTSLFSGGAGGLLKGLSGGLFGALGGLFS
jgi:hypothetical protein